MSAIFLDLPQCLSARGVVHLPGSKSLSNRALLLAALSEGETELYNLLEADDTSIMRNALVALGVEVLSLGGGNWCVKGIGAADMQWQFPQTRAELFLGNAGTAMRSLTAVLAVAGGDYTLRGVERMHQRPINDLVDALRQWGCRVDYQGETGYPPLQLHPAVPVADTRVHKLQVRGDVSSQFLSGLLMALPLRGKKQAIEVVGELISKPYVEMTLALMRHFGVEVKREGWKRFEVDADSGYRSPRVFHIEGDASSASYFLALGAIATPPGETLRVEGVGAGSLQGDIVFAEALQQMGARVDISETHISVSSPEHGLQGVTLDCNAFPDAAMTLAVTALFAHGTTRLNHIASWRVKESDRIVAMQNGLEKLGACVKAGDDYLSVTPPKQLTAAAIDTYDDHRVAMSFALVACGVAVRINDPTCVDKTFPDYFDHFARLVSPVPVIAIDGPSASGKGTVAARVSEKLGWRYLDSGALYRLTALAAQRTHVDWHDEICVSELAARLPARFDGEKIWLARGMGDSGGSGDNVKEDEVSDEIRSEAISAGASVVAAWPRVREALLFRQRTFRITPGLVAEGRDMASTVFPDAHLKIFLTASVEARAERRYKQLLNKGDSVKMADLLADLRRRDTRDSTRGVAPLRQETAARLLDTTAMDIDEAVAQVLAWHVESGV